MHIHSIGGKITVFDKVVYIEVGRMLALGGVAVMVLMELRSIGRAGILLGQGLSWCRHCPQEDFYGVGTVAQAAFEAC